MILHYQSLSNQEEIDQLNAYVNTVIPQLIENNVDEISRQMLSIGFERYIYKTFKIKVKIKQRLFYRHLDEIMKLYDFELVTTKIKKFFTYKNAEMSNKIMSILDIDINDLSTNGQTYYSRKMSN